eukprot:g72494.t1
MMTGCKNLEPSDFKNKSSKLTQQQSSAQRYGQWATCILSDIVSSVRLLDVYALFRQWLLLGLCFERSV